MLAETLLSRWLPQHQSRPPTPTRGESTQTRQLTERSRIARLLTRLAEVRALVTVELPESDGIYGSAVLSIGRSGGGYLVLDELIPASGHDLVTAGMVVTVSARLEGVSLRFKTLVESIDGTSEIAFYRLALPARLHYNQRRSAYRARLGPTWHVPVHLGDPLKGSARGRLSDISTGGLAVCISPANNWLVARGDHLANCTLALPDRPKIISEVDICHVSHVQHTTQLLIGARLCHLSNRPRAAIQRFIAEVERTRVKRRAHTAS